MPDQAPSATVRVRMTMVGSDLENLAFTPCSEAFFFRGYLFADAGSPFIRLQNLTASGNGPDLLSFVSSLFYDPFTPETNSWTN